MNNGTLGFPRHAALPSHFSPRGGKPRRWLDKGREVISIEDFGIKPTNTPLANRLAWDRAYKYAVANGCVLNAGPGTFNFADEILITDSAVRLRGAGSGQWLFGQRTQRGTCFKYAGPDNAAKAVVRIEATVAGNDNLYANGIEGISLDCGGGLAGRGLHLGSVCNGIFKDIVVHGGPDAAGVYIYAVNTAAVTFSLHNRFESVFVAVGGAGLVHCFTLDGIPGGTGANGRNCAFNTFLGCHATHKDGFGFLILSGDDNDFYGCAASRALDGTGNSIFLGGTSDGTFKGAVGNRFFGFVGAATPTGTASPIRSQGGTYPARGNYIHLVSVDGTPVITTDEGTTLYYKQTGGPDTTHIAEEVTPTAIHEREDAVNNGASAAQRLRKKTTGVPAVGIGVSSVWEIETSAGVVTNGATDSAFATVLTGGAESVARSLATRNGGVSQEVWRTSLGAHYFPLVATTVGGGQAAKLNNASSPANELLRDTSSARHKRDIEDIGAQYAGAVLQLRPVWYRSALPADRPDWSWYGFLAEEVAKIDPRLAHWGYPEDAWDAVTVGEGEDAQEQRRLKPGAQLVPDGVAYDRLTVPLLFLVQKLTERVSALEAALPAANP